MIKVSGDDDENDDQLRTKDSDPEQAQKLNKKDKMAATTASSKKSVTGGKSKKGLVHETEFD